ncbi:ATP-binding protein [Kineosporia sp. NBRC 101677]|uniref:ATP-binding protein n=1 Tax=Kineosporia sp. NBRC 101677 TaxID=3032197 RepID=UPI0024A3B1A2|nr:SbcC/MukB-like Walker B domain-containing protein [Kineosporia sp. NBRC 101677]GLY20135.1 ATP-binding protein [Kineosporia sp. NBRC 101677]
MVEVVMPPSSGFRLRRLEVWNWGTFHHKVWSLEIAGGHALVTGDIGSGKSTLVDAVTTLLLPANRISYNKAAGAQTRERDLRSYVLGHHKFERNELTGNSRPVALRSPGQDYSALVAVFASGEAVVSLAQVYWLKEGQAGQPERLFVVADRELSIAGDLAGFGSEIAALKRRLKKQPGTGVHDSFPPYGNDFRRRMGIASDQAMELFHQTVSMKSVSNLNDFVRTHMLEPFDADRWINQILLHFEDLTRAHDSVVRARRQLEALTPILDEGSKYDDLSAQQVQLAQVRAHLPFFTAARRLEAFAAEAEAGQKRIDGLAAESRQLTKRSGELESQREQLQLQRAGLGGDRLHVLEESITRAVSECERRRATAEKVNELLGRVELTPITDARGFAQMREALDEVRSGFETASAEVDNRLTDIAVEQKEIKSDSDEIRDELTSLQQRRSNIPRRSLQLRDQLCEHLGVSTETLPFAGELIQVRNDAAAWEGAAERVLHGFGLSLLVPNSHYGSVAAWINDRHLGVRLVYYRVPATLAATHRHQVPGPETLFHRLEIKSDSEFYGWIERELFSRAAHVCASTMDAFQLAERAVTVTGQIKEARRHVKDDSKAIDDRRNYVLGWSNQAKVDALLAQALLLNNRRQQLVDEQKRLADRRDVLRRQGTALDQLDVYQSYDDLDHESVSRQIARDQAEKDEIERSSKDLERITDQLKSVAEELLALNEQIQQGNRDLGRAHADLERAGAGQRECLDVLQSGEDVPEPAGMSTYVPDPAPATADAWQNWERSTGDRVTIEIDRRQKLLRTCESNLVRLMSAFREANRTETADMDASVEALGEFRAMHHRLLQDDLPRFEAEFKNFLNTNTIRDIAMFRSKLAQEEELIRERVGRINTSLNDIDYNPGRYITLETTRTPNIEIRDFRSELHACTDDALGGDGEQYSEQKFLQVQKLVERFRGRAGQVDADKAWTRRVTDVRNWFVFSASERHRDDDSEFETYTDSAGKSGGQKEKLAYTILAASLAYQFQLDSEQDKTFRFVVIDEAFGRGSDESTRFALTLFRRIGLQLLIVTPLQKIHVIEPYVDAVGFVENKTGSNSRLQTLTIEEFRTRRELHRMVDVSKVETVS